MADETTLTVRQIRTSLSLQLINASLSGITILGAIFVFVRDKNNATTASLVLALLSVVLFSVSAFLGGKGIEREVKRLRNIVVSRKNYFGFQSIFLLIGIVSALFSVAFVKPNKDSSELDRMFARQNKLSSEIGGLRLRIYELERESKIERMQK